LLLTDPSKKGPMRKAGVPQQIAFVMRLHFFIPLLLSGATSLEIK